MRLDNFGYPVVIPTGSVFVTAGTDRRSSGTHYTPRVLTEPIVQYTLEPLVYVGPAEGWPKSAWKLKSAKELLDLKICDMACGSGAFLVQVCRYLAARLLEAWDEATRREGQGARGEGEEGNLREEHERTVLSRVDCLAEVDGPGKTLLSDNEDVSKERTVRDDQPNSSVGVVSSGEHSGGERTGTYEGVLEPSQYRQGIVSGSRDSSDSVSRSGTAKEGGLGQMPESSRRNKSNVGQPSEVSGISTLSQSPDLDPRPSTLIPRPSHHA